SPLYLSLLSLRPSYTLCFLSFFFQRYGDHRALHSFPTRRSSDLEVLADLHLGGVHVGAPGEADDDDRGALPGGRLHRLDALDGGDRALDRLGQQRLDVARARALVGRDDRDDRELDLGQPIEREVREREEAEADEAGVDHRRGHATADREAAEAQGLASAAGSAALVRTAAPSRRRCCPCTTSSSVPSSPSVISTNRS